ncbi:MAG: LysR substrate-binding domain-containing protein [Woeseiaceae bacterium]|nr:LysR substrate-binding domain-containing protein [Woeseiaceae bacterium]
MASKTRTSLRGLRTFCIAARHESFRTAGDELFITPSAVSHQIKSLEEELGKRLFDRNSRELKLTKTGREFYEEVSPLIEKLDAVAASYRSSAVSSSVRISVQPFFASEYFVPRLSEFTAEHPEIDIEVGTSDESAETYPADADISIRLFKSPPANTNSNLLFPLRLVPAGSPSFKRSLEVSKKEITSDFPLIVHETQPKAWKRWSKVAGVKLPGASKTTRLDSMIAVVRACERGIGAALVPVPIADLWFEQGSIVRLFDTELVADMSYYVIVRDDAEAGPGIALLSAWILESFAGDR